MEKARGTLQKIIIDAVRRVPPEQAPSVAWPFACGTAVAAKTRVLDFKDGLVRVEVPDARWRSQLMDMAAQYVSILRQYSGQAITRIEFLVRETGEQK